MSKFYMARDRKTGQIVGLKILNKEKTDAFEERFKGLKKPSEGEIAAQLKHPNIVETYEYGLTTEGEPLVFSFIVNGFRVPSKEIDAAVDRALLRLVEFKHANHLP